MSLEFFLRLVGMMVCTLLGALLGTDLSDALNLPPEATGLTFSLMGALAGLIITPWVTTYPARAAQRMIMEMPAESLAHCCGTDWGICQRDDIFVACSGRVFIVRRTGSCASWCAANDVGRHFVWRYSAGYQRDH